MTSFDDIMASNRRRFLRGLVGLGASATAASLLTPQALAEMDYDPETEVPRIHGFRRTNREAIRERRAAPEYEPIRTTISREKWAQVEAAWDVRDRVEKRLSDMDPTPRVAVGWTANTQERRRAVRVHHRTERRPSGKSQRRPDLPFDRFEDEVKERFPDEMRGLAGRGTDAETVVDAIPVRVTKETGIRPQFMYDYKYRDLGVPAGCLIRRGGDGNAATLGPELFDANYGEWIYLTAGHVALGSSDGRIYQNTTPGWWSNGDHLADVNDAKTLNQGTFDAAVLNNVQVWGSGNFASDSGANAYQGPTITGMQTKSGLKDLGISDTIYKQGIATGRVTGSIYDLGPDSIQTFHTEDNGDSGGPYWVEDGSGGALISAIHQRGDGFYSYATHLPAIIDRFNLSAI